VCRRRRVAPHARRAFAFWTSTVLISADGDPSWLAEGAFVGAVSMRIGTRKSTMALVQTEDIARRLSAAAPELNVEIVKFETTGDNDQTSKLLIHGGKGGAFVAEIRTAVLAGRLHAAMHSLKDMPGNEDTPGLVIGATLARDPPTDVLVLRNGLSIEDIERSHGKGYKIGTNAVRRAAYARRLYPEIEVIHFRGAADTRIRKLDNKDMQRLSDGGGAGPADALIMARSGLERVGLANRIALDFSPQDMLPAVGQGIVAVECAGQDWQTRQCLSLIDDRAAHLCCDAEREVLWVLNGHCNSPIAGYSTIDNAQMSLTASVLDEVGARFIEVTRSGPANRPRELGRAVGLELLDKGAAELIARTRPEP
jgi:hydroxymethylbilane synthase